MAFTDRVLERWPQIDTARVCVTGGSYGGFMTNWIIGHTGRFAAAASQRSISNWLSFAFTSDIGEGFAADQMGLSRRDNFWDSRETLWRHSPLAYARSCTTPTLFLHSDEDYRCPLSEGYQMYSALKQCGVEARMYFPRREPRALARRQAPAPSAPSERDHELVRKARLTGGFPIRSLKNPPHGSARAGT